MISMIRFVKEAFKSWRTPDSDKLQFIDINKLNELRKNYYINSIDLFDDRRIINPPKVFICDSNFVETETEIAIGKKPIKVLVALTSHGVYIKPNEKVCKCEFERIFGFRSCCLGYDPECIVYYPSYKKRT
jgi:hypothetical protein